MDYMAFSILIGYTFVTLQYYILFLSLIRSANKLIIVILMAGCHYSILYMISREDPGDRGPIVVNRSKQTLEIEDL